jgi:F-type H+-transporting ATPase subunit delta
MKSSRAAYRYAKALLSYATEAKAAMEVAEDMQRIVNAFQENAELSVFLHNAVVPLANKKAAVQQLFSEATSTTQQLFELLSHNKRISLLEGVAQKYLELNDQQQGKILATVTTAVPLDEATRKLVLEKAKSLNSAKVTLENQVDPSIIGGFILRVGDLEYNASITQQLEQYKRALTQTNYTA